MMTPSIDTGLIYRGTPWTVDGVPMGYARPPRKPLLRRAFSAALFLLFLAMAAAPAMVPAAPSPAHHLYASAGATPVDNQAIADASAAVKGLSVAGALGLLTLLVQGAVKLKSTYESARISDLEKQVAQNKIDRDTLVSEAAARVTQLRSADLAQIEALSNSLERLERQFNRKLADERKDTVSDVQGVRDQIASLAASVPPVVPANVEAAKPAG